MRLCHSCFWFVIWRVLVAVELAMDRLKENSGQMGSVSVPGATIRLLRWHWLSYDAACLCYSYVGADGVRVDDDDVPTQHLLYPSLNSNDDHVQIKHVRYATKRVQVMKTDI